MAEPRAGAPLELRRAFVLRFEPAPRVDLVEAALRECGFTIESKEHEPLVETELDTGERDLARAGASLLVRAVGARHTLLAREMAVYAHEEGLPVMALEERLCAEVELAGSRPPRLATRLPLALRDLVVPFALEAALGQVGSSTGERHTLTIEHADEPLPRPLHVDLFGAGRGRISFPTSQPPPRYATPAADARLARLLSERCGALPYWRDPELTDRRPQEAADVAVSPRKSVPLGAFVRKVWERHAVEMQVGELWLRAESRHREWQRQPHGSWVRPHRGSARLLAALAWLSAPALPRSLARAAREHFAELLAFGDRLELVADAARLLFEVAVGATPVMENALVRATVERAPQMRAYEAQAAPLWAENRRAVRRLCSWLDRPARLRTERALRVGFRGFEGREDARRFFVATVEAEGRRLRADLARRLGPGTRDRVRGRLARLAAAEELLRPLLGGSRLRAVAATTALLAPLERLAVLELAHGALARPRGGADRAAVAELSADVHARLAAARRVVERGAGRLALGTSRGPR